jgi:hypothetical protein
VKGTYLSQINRASIEGLIQELDLLMATARDQQNAELGGPSLSEDAPPTQAAESP